MTDPTMLTQSQYPGQNPNQPTLASTQLSPQQRMAMALMQQQPQVNQQGQMSPWQGASQIANQMLAAKMLSQSGQQPIQLGNNVSAGALQNANASTDPLGTLAATQGWNQ